MRIALKAFLLKLCVELFPQRTIGPFSHLLTTKLDLIAWLWLFFGRNMVFRKIFGPQLLYTLSLPVAWTRRSVRLQGFAGQGGL